MATVMLLAAVFASNALCAAPDSSVDADWILRQLARPVPSRTDFVELRDSKLLKQPLRLSGEYARPDVGTLVREVRAPYLETTTLRDGEASIARAGKSPRRFSLSRAPELAGLQASFGAMLSGDRALLEQSWRLQTDGSHRQWRMTLLPRDAAVAAKVRDITLHGRGDELRCIETRAAKGDEIQRTLLGSAAHDAAGVEAGADLIALCRGGEG